MNTALMNSASVSSATCADVRRSKMPVRSVTGALLLMLCLVGGLAPSAARAQSNDTRPDSYTRGLYIDGMLGGSSISYDASDGVDPGVLASGRIGYGFTDLFGIFLEFGGGAYAADQDLTRAIHPQDYVAGFFDLGAQFNFRSGKEWVPYAEISLNGIATADEFENSLSGGGLTLGGGVKYYITDAWALNGRIQVTGHSIESADLEGVRFENVDEDATSTRFAFGLTWYVLR